MSEVQQRIVEHIRRHGGLTAKQLAQSLGISPSNARKHLKLLQSMGAVKMAATCVTNSIGYKQTVWDVTR